jgi:3-hydroxybutyryl-CoA dehydratase
MPPPPTLPRRIPAAPVVGAKASFTRTLTDGDVSLFIGATWDVNPYHTDDTFSARARFGRRIVPGLLTASLFTHVGGLWGFLATSMQFDFVGPVYVGDTVTAEMEVTEAAPERRWVKLACRCLKQDGTEVLRGTITGLAAPHEHEGA